MPQGPSRVLIVNADDFGLSPEINGAVRHGFETGVITDSSLLINGSHSRQAVRIIKELPHARAGIHLNLDALLGWDSPGRERFSRGDLQTLLEDSKVLQRIRQSMMAQIERFLDTGLVPSHVDTHHHVHGFRPIFSCLLDVMEEYEIRSLRFSRDGYHLLSREAITLPPETVRWMEREMKSRTLAWPDHFIDGTLHGSVSDLPEGVSELMVHPALSGEDWRVHEWDRLADPDFIARLRQHQIALINFSEIPSLLSSLT